MVKPCISFASLPPCVRAYVCGGWACEAACWFTLYSMCSSKRTLGSTHHHCVLCLQLENATKGPEQNSTGQEEEGKDHKDGAIEMDFDFEGHVEDVDQDDEGNPEEEEDSGPEEELTEKMGDLGNELGEELDKSIWDPQEEDKVFIL